MENPGRRTARELIAQGGGAERMRRETEETLRWNAAGAELQALVDLRDRVERGVSFAWLPRAQRVRLLATLTSEIRGVRWSRTRHRHCAD